ncbi:hypothetical protein [Silvanigrella sp.]|jgi:hypothetical protein|uniref:hypothetical protein n=1 Tax=Silvanigrella sp. TaxID=2024976 RepID=UPI0037C681EA|nr:hypothetical protein [Silvanigrellaceae bacterium]
MMDSKVLAELILKEMEKSKPSDKKAMWESISKAIVTFLSTNVEVIPATMSTPSGSVTGLGKLQ